jgi:hypothetical protein
MENLASVIVGVKKANKARHDQKKSIKIPQNQSVYSLIFLGPKKGALLNRIASAALMPH